MLSLNAYDFNPVGVIVPFDLTIFADVTNATTSAGSGNNLSAEMKVFYDSTLIDHAEPNLIHNQFGQKKPIPANRGKTIEFRKYSQLPKALTPLTEGVTPDGQALNVTTITATVAQYGGFIRVTDMLLLTALDNNIIESTKLLGSQSGRTLDTVVREVLNGGTSVQYADGSVTSRSALARANKLTVAAIKRAVRALKTQNAPKINGNYVGIIHPDVSFDLMNDPEWKEMSKYTTPELAFRGEIGMIAGVRFVETTEAKIFAGAGSGSVDVYSTLILGANAYGVTDVAGGGLQTIIKQLGAGEDPLNQRATVGWKAVLTAERLVEQNMVRIETASTFDSGAN